MIVLCNYWMPLKILIELNMSVYLNFYGTEICVDNKYNDKIKKNIRS